MDPGVRLGDGMKTWPQRAAEKNRLYWQEGQESRVNSKQEGVWGVRELGTPGKVDL